MALTAASSQRYAGRWLVAGTTPPGAEVQFAKNDPLPIARLMPPELRRLDQDARVPRKNLLAAPAGRLMIPVGAEGRKLCELERHAGSAFACLADDDGDGRFETYFGVQVFKEYFFGTVSGEQSRETLSTAVTASAADPAQDAPIIPLELVYLGGSESGEFRYKVCTSKTSVQKVVFGQVGGNSHLSRYCFGDNRSAMAGQPFNILGIEVVPIRAEEKFLVARVTPGKKPVDFTTYSNYQ